jgi:hypothetical protein
MSPVTLLLFVYVSLFTSEKFTVVEDLSDRWKVSSDEGFETVHASEASGLSTLYFSFGRDEFAGATLHIQSANPYFIFLNGKISGKYQGVVRFAIDSLARIDSSPAFHFAIHQDRINPRDLRTQILSNQQNATVMDGPRERPYFFFRDFVVVAGLLIVLFFVVISRLNPKLAADYFSPSRVISQRDTDDSQASARLTSGANVQFYVLCSMLVGYYLMITFYNLPSRYALPTYFYATDFWSACLQWFKLTLLILVALLGKIAVIYGLTRLFDMRGLARIHYFNFVRLLLLVFGATTVIQFAYYIGRGSDISVFTVFLGLVVVALTLWVVLAFFKLSGRTGHSLFHLFSYLCATEIIPLLVTAKVLFQ